MGDVDYGDLWRSALDGQLPVLQQNLLLNDYFYAHLIQKRIFSQDTIEEIKGETSSDARILKMIGYLKKRTNECFEDFLSILVSTDNRFVKEIIEQSIRSNRLRRQGEKSPDLLKLKDARIEELEEEIQDLTRRLTEADRISKMEMDRSRYYLEVINNLTTVRTAILTQSSCSFEDRELELEDMAVEMDSLKEQVEILETHLQRTTSDLEKTKRQLNTVIESEKMIKRNLGLQEDADEMEVSARIQEMKRSQAKLKTTQDELDRINEMKDAYVEKIRKLSQDVSRMNADRRRKDFQLQRMKRNKEDNHVLQNVHTILNGSRPNPNNPSDKRVPKEINLPIIDIRLPSPRNRTISRKFPSAPEILIPPQFQLPRANSTVRSACHTPINEPRYCVLCRCEYYASEPCRIHTAAKHDGRYTCCNVAENGVLAMGCRTLQSHLYAQFAGVDNECRFYDQQGKLVFCFKNNWGEVQFEKRPAFLSVR